MTHSWQQHHEKRPNKSMEGHVLPESRVSLIRRCSTILRMLPSGRYAETVLHVLLNVESGCLTLMNKTEQRSSAFPARSQQESHRVNSNQPSAVQTPFVSPEHTYFIHEQLPREAAKLPDIRAMPTSLLPFPHSLSSNSSQDHTIQTLPPQSSIIPP